jgi:chromosome partitioning protein
MNDTIVMSYVSQKGGTGKSTFVRATARAAADDDMKVKIGDLDIRQGTTIEWYRTRLAKSFKPVGSVEFFGSAKDALNSVNSETDLLLLDGPARASKETLEIAQASHLVIQPTGPSLDDLKPSVLLFHELVKKGIPKDRLVMVLNRVGTEAEFKDAYDYISQSGYQALDEFIFEKPAYRQAQNIGLTILETRFTHLNQSAVKVINALINIILGHDNE